MKDRVVATPQWWVMSMMPREDTGEKYLNGTFSLLKHPVSASWGWAQCKPRARDPSDMLCTYLGTQNCREWWTGGLRANARWAEVLWKIRQDTEGGQKKSVEEYWPPGPIHLHLMTSLRAMCSDPWLMEVNEQPYQSEGRLVSVFALVLKWCHFR